MPLKRTFIPYGAYFSSPFCRWQGAFASENAVSLAARTTRAFLKRKQIAAEAFDSVVLGITVPQKHTAKRHKLFAAACESVRASGESLLLSPEGTRVTSGTVGHFNKGAFHLATELRANIVPLYIEIPSEVDPGKGWLVKGCGKMVIHELDEIDTSGWSLNDLDDNAALVRERYLAFQSSLAPRAAPSARARAA